MSVQLHTSLTSETVAHLAAAHLLTDCLPPILEFTPDAVNQRDVEKLHRFRIGLRKSRAILKSLVGVIERDVRKEFSQQLRLLYQLTNPIRDFDVFLSRQVEYEKRLPLDAIPGSTPLFSYFAIKRHLAWKALTFELQRSAYANIVPAWREFVQQMSDPHSPALDSRAKDQVLDHACAVLSQSLAKLMNIIWLTNEGTPFESLHKTRFQAKTLRYQLEAYGPLLGKAAADSVLKRLKIIQKKMGDYCDLMTEVVFLWHHRPEVLTAAGDEAVIALESLVGVLSTASISKKTEALCALREFTAKGGVAEDCT
jgi:CHAD domain-containing protein